jgi:hypothetical protein
MFLLLHYDIAKADLSLIDYWFQIEASLTIFAFFICSCGLSQLIHQILPNKKNNTHGGSGHCFNIIKWIIIFEWLTVSSYLLQTQTHNFRSTNSNEYGFLIFLKFTEAYFRHLTALNTMYLALQYTYTLYRVKHFSGSKKSFIIGTKKIWLVQLIFACIAIVVN